MITSKLVGFFALAQLVTFAVASIAYKIAVANSNDPEFAGFGTWPLWLLFYLLGVLNLLLIPLYLYRITSKRYNIQRSWVTIAMICVLAMFLVGYYLISKQVES